MVAGFVDCVESNGVMIVSDADTITVDGDDLSDDFTESVDEKNTKTDV